MPFHVLRFAPILLPSLVLGLPACGVAASAPPAPRAALQPASVTGKQASASASCLDAPCIYIANPTFGRHPKVGNVLIYNGDASGNVAPIESIAGPNTRLNHPGAVAVDSSHNVYVTNFHSVTVYAPGTHGNTAPIQFISGSNTELPDAEGIAVDAGRNIYVANAYRRADPRHSRITVFAAGANGNVAPIQSISGKKTGLDTPWGIAVDDGRNIYVANIYTASTYIGSVTVYAAGANGNVAPIQTITGPNTGLQFPFGIAVDGARNIYVANSSDCCHPQSVFIFAAGANGNVAPIQTISGPNTLINNPWGIAVDARRNIYVANSSNSVTVYAAGANGDVAPIQYINGSNTGLTFPTGIAVR